MAIMPIRIYPDPVLRVRCPEVTTFDDDLATLVADMVETMHDAPGVGLAAPQVGVEQRIMVVDLSIGEDPKALHVFINPEILERQGKAAEVEGCLSIPGFSEKVERAEAVAVRGRTVTGEVFEMEADDWLARAILHETDHLDGVLFVDYLRGLRKDRARRQLRKLAEQQGEEARGSGAAAAGETPDTRTETDPEQATDEEVGA